MGVKHFNIHFGLKGVAMELKQVIIRACVGKTNPYKTSDNKNGWERYHCTRPEKPFHSLTAALFVLTVFCNIPV